MPNNHSTVFPHHCSIDNTSGLHCRQFTLGHYGGIARDGSLETRDFVRDTQGKRRGAIFFKFLSILFFFISVFFLSSFERVHIIKYGVRIWNDISIRNIYLKFQ